MIFSTAESGINLSDVWDDLSPVRHKKRKHRKANELPQVLTDRIVKIAGRRGGILIDPFVGTGTSLVSALQAHMTFVGNDLSLKNARISLDRLATIERSLKR